MDRYNSHGSICCNVVLCLILAACGGNAPADLERSEYLPHSGSNGPEESNANLRRRLDLGYDFAGSPSSAGFNAVFMLNNEAPAPQQFSRITVSATTSGQRAKVKLGCASAATGSGALVVHLRYDPARWEPEGILHQSPWGTGNNYVTCARVLDPGVLLIVNAPVDETLTPVGGRAFADTTFLPAGSRRVSSTPPSGNDSIGTVWYAEGSNPTPTESLKIGGTEFWQDGLLGWDTSVRNGYIADSNDSHVDDSTIQDALVTAIGTQCQEADWPTSFAMSFTSNFAGDTDNNGEANLADITQVGKLYPPHLDPPLGPIPPPYYSPCTAADAAAQRCRSARTRRTTTKCGWCDLVWTST
jgi:hypothetical protein